MNFFGSEPALWRMGVVIWLLTAVALVWVITWQSSGQRTLFLAIFGLNLVTLGAWLVTKRPGRQDH